ncbi:nucleotidyltransferase substrate binding protein [Desulfovibrionales bacterium]
MQHDIRWKQRLDNYLKALQTLRHGVELAKQRALTELEQQGLVQGFEFTHELAWNVLKDFLEHAGISGIIGSKGTTREAFKNDLLEEGQTWMDMIKARNLSSHTYNPETAQAIVQDILTRFYPEFEKLADKLSALAEQEE